MFSTKVTWQIAKRLKKVPRSSRKNGWSPTFVAYKANLDALLEIRRHYLGQHKCIRWQTSLDISTGIIKQITKWCETVSSLGIEREVKEAALSITSHSPEYWLTVEAMDPALLATLEHDMNKLKSEMHGRQRNGQSWASNKVSFGNPVREIHYNAYKDTREASVCG